MEMERDDRGPHLVASSLKRLRGKTGESKEDLGDEMNELREKNNRTG